MRDTAGDEENGREPEIPMTILAISGGYWLYEGEDLLNDLLFGNGTYPFQVRCVHFKDVIEMNTFFGEGFTVSTLWRINPDVVDRLRRDKLLVEVSPIED